jgi:L,D-peptidoglycan transpeptidase YkuD (ErfK/YbiS/YcfS/YnhG family)
MNSLAKAAAGAALLVLCGGAQAETPASCPATLLGVERLVLVLSPDLASVGATVQFYERTDGQKWKAVGKAKTAALGRNGMAWSYTNKRLAGSDRIKTEGDGRTPAGFFALDKPFGFAAKGPDGYVRLKPGAHYCVDDPTSPHYNQIVTKAEASGASGEDMGAIPLYRQGLFVDYPTGSAEKGGSCIFVHTWRAKGAGTAGCVALAERDVKEMQRWSAGHMTMIGILPESAWKTLRSCFPGS